MSEIPLIDFFSYIHDNKRDVLPKDEIFNFFAKNFVDITYGDITLKTDYSKVLPNKVSTFSYFSRHIPLKVPIVSAPMDTVTEKNMAIAMAMAGGLGVIHKNLSPDMQKAQINKVKLYMSARVDNPVSIFPDNSMEELRNMREHEGYKFHTFPVISRESGKLVGIITQNDFDFCENWSEKVVHLMSKKLITAKTDTSLNEAYIIMRKYKKRTLPLVDEENNLTGLYLFNDVLRVKSGESQSYNLDKKGHLLVGAAIGVGEKGLVRVDLLKDLADVFVLDSAHADTESMIGTLKDIKRAYPSLEVVIGNITEADSAKRLVEAGADGIKIGQGPGSICTTRIIAGIGKPQLSAIYACSSVADYHGVPVIADGGIKYSGDIPIALGAGAMSVMLGNLLAGTIESPGKEILFQGKKYKTYRGMGSLAAMAEHEGSKERYSQADASKEKIVPEGVEGMVPLKGSINDVMIQFVGGLRSGMGYVGAENIAELRLKANFNRSSTAGAQEAHPSVIITNEAPNYSSAR
jgi:IMP dehydrogenase